MRPPFDGAQGPPFDGAQGPPFDEAQGPPFDGPLIHSFSLNFEPLNFELKEKPPTVSNRGFLYTSAFLRPRGPNGTMPVCATHLPQLAFGAQNKEYQTHELYFQRFPTISDNVNGKY